jgi:hypothetical protein
MFGILSFVLFVIAAVLAWNHAAHADAIAYAGAACAVIEVVFAWRPWVHP